MISQLTTTVKAKRDKMAHIACPLSSLAKSDPKAYDNQTPMAFNALDQFRAPLKAALENFEQFFQSQIDHFEPELKEVIKEVLAHPGKRLRPMFVMGSAGLTNVQNERTIRMGAIVEFIHLASLVHDDILDSAESRHGATAHHVRFGPKISVLTGDTLFLRANELAAVEDDPAVGRAVAKAAKATCSGEIAQSLSAQQGIEFTFEQYKRFLLLKTGKLFGLSCELGAMVAGLPQQQVDGLREYGENFGIAYQLYDDAVDLWGTQEEYKKTLGTDIAQGKWTFPWLLLASKIGREATEELFADKTAALATFESEGIIEQSDKIFAAQIQKTQDCLHPSFTRHKEFAYPLEAVVQKWKSLRQTSFVAPLAKTQSA